MKKRATATEHEAEDSIREILGAKDYTLLVRYMAGSVRLLQKLEGAVAHRSQVKMSALSDDVRRAMESLREQLAGVPPPPPVPTRKVLPAKAARHLRMVQQAKKEKHR